MILKILFLILFVWLAIPVCYFMVFVTAAKFKKRKPSVEGTRTRRFIVLIPAYHSDSCILETAKSALRQNYPENLFSVLVISDGMREETLDNIRKAGADVLEVIFEQSTKAKALAAAINHLGPDKADTVVILDADNIVRQDFLEALDDAMCSGAKAVQAHRTCKNSDTSVAVIDAVSEEINNSIFRNGHCALGISSALIGSGMAFDYMWFANNVNDLSSSGEDKEIELQLLRDGIFVHYLDDVKVLDEKTRTIQNYSKQRRRWIASQYHLMSDAIRRFPVVKDKIGYADKLFQWCFPPRMIIISLIPLMAILLSLCASDMAVAWWILFAVLVASMLIGMPFEMINGKFLVSLFKAPALTFTAIVNIFRIKESKDKYIHTDHK